MEKILAENVPDLESAYKALETRRNNLELAKSKFGISDLLNSKSARMKAVFVNSLDDTDLDILVNKIEDPLKMVSKVLKRLLKILRLTLKTKSMLKLTLLRLKKQLKNLKIILSL